MLCWSASHFVLEPFKHVTLWIEELVSDLPGKDWAIYLSIAQPTQVIVKAMNLFKLQLLCIEVNQWCISSQVGLVNADVWRFLLLVFFLFPFYEVVLRPSNLVVLRSSLDNSRAHSVLPYPS